MQLRPRRNQRRLEDILREDRETLNRLGYAQELLREIGGFSNFAVSFSIILILTCFVLLYGYRLKYCGPRRKTNWATPGGRFCICVAASRGSRALSLPPTRGTRPS